MYIQGTIYNYVKCFQATGSILDSKTTHTRYVCTASILDNCHAQTLQYRS
jgi:hypothetical protein